MIITFLFESFKGNVMIVITRIFNVLSVLHTVEFNHLKMKIERIVWEKILSYLQFHDLLLLLPGISPSARFCARSMYFKKQAKTDRGSHVPLPRAPDMRTMLLSLPFSLSLVLLSWKLRSRFMASRCSPQFQFSLRGISSFYIESGVAV